MLYIDWFIYIVSQEPETTGQQESTEQIVAAKSYLQDQFGKGCFLNLPKCEFQCLQYSVPCIFRGDAIIHNELMKTKAHSKFSFGMSQRPLQQLQQLASRFRVCCPKRQLLPTFLNLQKQKKHLLFEKKEHIQWHFFKRKKILETEVYFYKIVKTKYLIQNM